MTAPLTPPDLDAIKAAGLNSDEHSQALLRAHWRREHAELEHQLQQKQRRDELAAIGEGA